MSVPTYDQFIEPLFRFLVEHPGGVPIADVFEAVATRKGLSAAERALLLPSGAQAVYKNRIGWAHDRLKRAGLSESPKRGMWRLTAAGVAHAKKEKRLSTADVERIANAARDSRIRAKDGAAPAIGPAAEPSVAEGSPDERIGAALSELRESVARDLLELIGRSPPDFFEQLVLDLLHAMGYGTSRADLQRVGGSGDGGIDGVISLDRLGLEKVYVQAKRWQAAVGSPEIQGFMGALQLQSANKGVFITTSRFSKEARDAAGRARGSIVLVDGSMLTSLMMDHGVAVTHKTLLLPRVDSDYFEDA